MTSKEHTTKPGSYVSTILEGEEHTPLTWRRQQSFIDELSQTPIQFIEMTGINKNTRKLKKKKANVKVVYVAAHGDTAGQYRRVGRRTCFHTTRKRKPEIVIALIAIFFLFVLISVVILSIYFSYLRTKSTVDVEPPVSTSTVTLASNATTISQNTTSVTSVTTADIKLFTTKPVTTQLTTDEISTTSSPTITHPGTVPSTVGYATPETTTNLETSSIVISSTTNQTIHVTTSDTTVDTILQHTSPLITPQTLPITTQRRPSTPQTQPSTSQAAPKESTTRSVTTKLFKHTTNFPATRQPEPTTLYPELTTIVEQTPVNVPIFYMSGPFTFEEAETACKTEGSQLAMRGDITKAATIGYNRCSFGWLRDMHIAMIIQESYASFDCERGQIGALYKAARDPKDKYSGAYCVKDPPSEPSLSSLRIGSNPNKTINWWVTTDPVDAYNLRHALAAVTQEGDAIKYPLMAAMKAVYTCCNSFNITYTLEEEPKTYVELRYSMSLLQKVIEIYRRELAPAKVYAHVSAKYETMMKYGAATSNRTKIIESLVELASTAGLDGLIMDYEPREEYTREHAATYVQFLNDFESSMRRKNMRLGTVISSWGILRFYDVFNSSNVDFYGSMSSTYYGNDVSKNKQNVMEMLSSINPSRIEIGLGLMHQSELVPKPKRNYRWDERRIREFVTWLDLQGISRIHVYPGHWRSHKTSEEYFLTTLSDFSLE